MMWAAASFSVRGAGKDITKLPKAEHEAAEWQAAMEALILGGDVGRAYHVRADWRHDGVEPPR